AAVQAVRDLNTGGALGNAGPPLGGQDIPAQKNNFGGSTFAGIEKLIYYHLDNSGFGFVASGSSKRPAAAGREGARSVRAGPPEVRGSGGGGPGQVPGRGSSSATSRSSSTASCSCPRGRSRCGGSAARAGRPPAR